ncbi:MAG TPA: alpha/beta hydrolase [Ferrovibrio sp.]|uniref:alpha/beta fold hydrolase n=1 Tax=Ferrovibrio sp. TaxID=1917215 RepID=UPI002ED40355
MHVAESGQGRPIIFLHGWSSHGGYFAPQAALAAGYHLLMPDLPGHGHSRTGSADLGIPALAAALHDLIQSRRLQDIVLVGWSMGALVGFEYIGRYGSDALAGMVIEDMTAKIINDAEWKLGIRNGFNAMQSAAAVRAMRSDWPTYATHSAPRLFAAASPATDGLQSWAEAEIIKNDGATMAALWASMAKQDYRHLLPRLRLPVLLIHGGDSQLYEPAVSHWMQANIPGADRICLERAGHSPHLEMPAEFNAALGGFLARLP